MVIGTMKKRCRNCRTCKSFVPDLRENAMCKFYCEWKETGMNEDELVEDCFGWIEETDQEKLFRNDNARLTNMLYGVPGKEFKGFNTKSHGGR